MRRSLLLVLTIFYLGAGSTNAQRENFRDDFMNAESWFLFEDYLEAEPLYIKLLDEFPGNDNLKYRLGICLLNDPYKKDQSIKYLLEASNNINPDYKEGSFKETTAPPDVLFYLGNAYLVNELMEQAIESYESFLEILDPNVYDEELVKDQIKACKNASRLKTMPVDIDLYLLDSTINTRYSEINPVISGDGNRMAFVTKQPFFDEALFIEKEDGKWTLPMSITTMLGFDEDIYPVALNYDGSEMLLYYDDEHIGNLYIASYKDGFWGTAEKLGSNISTKYWESHACFTKDGNSIYFTSNRKGTIGGLDIYTSTRDAAGNWSAPVNLGPNVNTRFNEETPFITGDGQTLYFSSYGHYNIGGYDVFYVKKQEDGSWGTPVNMGYPINTTDDDLFFHPVKNGKAAYYSLYSSVGAGRHDIYYMDIFSVNNPRMYLVSGNLRTVDGKTDLNRMALYILDAETGDTLMTVPIDHQGDFSMNLKQGNYTMLFRGEGYKDLVKALNITRESNKKEIRLEDDLELALVKEEKEIIIFEGEQSLIGLRDTLYEGEVGEAVRIPVRVEKGSQLITRIWKDSTLITTDTIIAERRRIVLEIDPLPGKSIVELETTDEDGNIHRNHFTLIGKEPKKPGTGEEGDGEDGAGTDMEGPVVADMASPHDKADSARYSNPAALTLTRMIEHSDGALRETIAGLDPEKEGINSTRELAEYLYEHAEEGGYTPEEVDAALAASLSGNDAQKLLDLLRENATGALANYLKNLDLEKEGINTVDELLDHLSDVADQEGFKMEDVREAMIRSTDPVGAALEDMKAAALDPLVKLLEQIDPEQEAISSEKELFENLYLKAEQAGLDKKEIDLLLAGELAGDNPELPLRKLIENADGPLARYLDGLDLDREGIGSIEDLLEHLASVAEQEGFSTEDVRSAMLKALDPAGEALAALIPEAEGPLKEFLEELDPGALEIRTERDLFESLYMQSDVNEFTREDVDLLLAKKLAGDDPDLLLQYLRENSGGRLKEYLEAINLEEKGITSVEQLLNHLSAVADEEGFSAEDVRNAMLAALDNPLEVEKLLKDVLEGMEDPGFIMADVRQAMIRGLDQEGSSIEDLKSGAGGDLAKWLGRIDMDEAGITSAMELAEYLYENVDSEGVDAKEVDLLLAGELAGEDVSKLRDQLKQNSTGKLKDYLENLDLEKEGIATVREFMDHLSSVTARAELRRILEEIDPGRDGIHTTEQLIDEIYRALLEKGYSNEDINSNLKDLFPEHGAYIDSLTESGKGRKLALWFGIGSGALLLLFLWFSRKKKKEEVSG